MPRRITLACLAAAALAVVDWIAVAAQGMRHVAVVARIAHWRGQDAIDEDRAGCLVDLVLDRFGILWNFDDDVDVVGQLTARIDQVQRHDGSSLQCVQ